MTDDEWAGIALLLDKGWKGSFGAAEQTAYRVLLDGFSAAQLAGALRVLVAKGSPFLPAAAEIAAEVRRDVTVPTFGECYRLIYGPRGALRARSPYCGLLVDVERKRDEAAMARAAEFHPLVGAFIRSQGLTRLRMLHVDDPDHGELVRKQLGEEWARFVEATEHRNLAALAAPRGARGLASFDPLATLGTRPHSAVTRPTPPAPRALAPVPTLSTFPSPSPEESSR